MIKNTLFNINKKGGLFFFNKPNNLYYIIFNKLYQKLISKKTDDSEIREFLNKGFFKTKINSNNLINKISEETIKQNANDKKGFFHFEINEKMKKDIKNFVNQDLKSLLTKFEKFYNINISVAKIIIKRNYHIKNKSSEVYSNHYHVDHNIFNHFKIFINLMDIDKLNGPLHIYSKQDSKEFVKKSNYKNRNDYSDLELEKKVFINTGKKGDVLVADTTECLHKAGEVEKGYHRDILFITFMTIPEKINLKKNFFYFDDKFKNSVWGKNENKEVISLAKPKSLRKTIKTFFEYYNNKLT